MDYDPQFSPNGNKIAFSSDDISSASSGTPAPHVVSVRRRAHVLLPGIGGLIVGAVLTTFIVWHLWQPPTAAVVRSTIELPPGTRLTGGFFPVRTELAFSPDGKYLAFSASSDGTGSGTILYLRALGGANPEPIKGTEGARHFWSDNGKILWGAGEEGLHWIPADGGDAEVLTRVDGSRETQHTLPFLLPGEKVVLFTVMPDSFGNRAHVEAASIPGGTRNVLVDDPADARYLPTGHIVFVRQSLLLAAPFDPSRVQLTGPAVPVIEGVEQALNVPSSTEHSGAGQFSVSGSGSLAYPPGGVGHLWENELVWVSRDTSRDAGRFR